MDLTISFATPLVIQPPQQPLIAMFTFQIGNFIFRGGSITMPTGQAVSTKASATMQSGSMAVCSVEWHDSGGHPVKVDGPTSWVSTDPTIVQNTSGPNGEPGNPQICNIYAPGPQGTASLQASADADLGSGVRKVTAILDITVIEGEAVAGEITFQPTGTHPPSPGGPSKGGAAPARRV